MAQVTLTITPIEGYPGNFRVVVTGSGFSPNQKVVWRLKGEDPAVDDNILAPRGAGLVEPDGTFAFSDDAISGHLNEDWGKDEVYAEVHYAEIGVRDKYKSNVIKRYF